MVKTILIIGLTQEHAGKTSLAQAMLAYFSNHNKKTTGFKPFSGYNYWYHFDMAHHTLSQGRLYSKDIAKLTKQSTVDTPIELLNPIHRLWNEPALMNGLNTIPPFIMDRFSISYPEAVEHHLLINQQLNHRIPEKYQRKIKEKNYTLHHIDTIKTMNEIIQTYYNKAIETCYEHVKKNVDVIVIESYADNALLPWNSLEKFDLVFGIKPWEIHKYDPDKYVKAVHLSKPISAWETSTKKLTDLLKPTQVFNQQPTISNNIIKQLKKQIPIMLE